MSGAPQAHREASLVFGGKGPERNHQYFAQCHHVLLSAVVPQMREPWYGKIIPSRPSSGCCGRRLSPIMQPPKPA
jgi:hypothetical protein